MDNNITEQGLNAPAEETLTERTAEAALTEATVSENTSANAENEELKAALAEARLKLALLLCGAAKEKLEEGAQLAAGFCLMGMQPEDAAAKTVAEYPHLKLISREVPTFAAQSAGSGDGFSAIRSIFARR